VGSVSVPFSGCSSASIAHLQASRARATSAAPLYFKPFHHRATDRVFTDGALNYNNPIDIANTESQLLWPDHQHPGIILSIGTGSKEPEQSTEFDTLPSSSKPPSNSMASHFKELAKIVARQIKQSIDSQRAWKEFIAKVSEGNAQKYVRIDVEFPKLPNIDSFKLIDDLVEGARSYCATQGSVIRDTANKLIASLFYLTLYGIEERAAPIPELWCTGKLEYGWLFRTY
jgi:patatin-like phospholipase/acyl hydrolase